MAFSFVGVLVILHMESTARVLIPHWEASLPPEARSIWSSGGPHLRSNGAATAPEADRAIHTLRQASPKTVPSCLNKPVGPVNQALSHD